MPQIIILGAGITALTIATTLQTTHPHPSSYKILLVARDLPAPFAQINPRSQINYTSPWAGAHNRFVPPRPSSPPTSQSHRQHGWSLTTFERMRDLAKTEPDAAGVRMMRGVELIEEPVGEEYLALDEDRATRELGMRGFRRLRGEEMPDGRVKWGCEYETWCVEPMVYCCFLMERFVKGGGRVVKREVVGGVEEVFGMGEELVGMGVDGGVVDLVVNATGYGLGGDEDMFVVRGQTVLVENECDVTVTRQNADGSWCFCVPRGFGGGTVIGGTKEVGNMEAEASPEVRERLLRAFKETWPAILGEEGEYRVIADIVGRRPTRRGGPRIELEVLEGNRPVMHAYGLGGRGYELSWGVAEEVAKQIDAYFCSQA